MKYLITLKPLIPRRTFYYLVTVLQSCTPASNACYENITENSSLNTGKYEMFDAHRDYGCNITAKSSSLNDCYSDFGTKIVL